jgi:hypothetical protein
MKANVSHLAERQNKTDERLDELDDKFVPYREFQATTQHVAESLKRIEINVRKLTDYLLERPNHPPLGRGPAE